MVTTCIIGARGYLGRETVRLLTAHPEVGSILPVSRTATGTHYGDAVPAFRGRDGLRFVPESDARDADVVFLATPSGKAKEYARDARSDQLIIDLSRDHRLEAIQSDGNGWFYGLADITRTPEGTRRVANPGCYPTASLIASAPALAAGLAKGGPIIADGKSGVSGAGVNPSDAFHYPEANEAVRAYKVEGHDHTDEIRAAAGRLDPDRNDRPVRFTPHLIPQTRGLLSTVYLPIDPDVDGDSVRDAYLDAYADAPFVRLAEEPNTAHVRGSNHADVAVTLDREAGLLVARCAIDNLVKGGAGTAVQNMNDALGLPTTMGLDHVGASP